MKCARPPQMYRCTSWLIGLSALLLAGSALPAPVTPKPVTLVYTTDTNGYLQACGCTAKQVGGLAKRATLLKEIRNRAAQAGRVVVLADGGNLGEDLQTSSAVLESCRAMGYQAVAMGATEERLGTPFLKEAKALKTPLVGLPTPPGAEESVPQTLLLPAGGQTIAILAIRGEPDETFRTAFKVALQAARSRARITVVFSDLTYTQEQRLLEAEDYRGLIDLMIGIRGSTEADSIRLGGVTLLPSTPRGTVGVIDMSGSGESFRFTHHFAEVSGDLPYDDQVQDIVTGYYNQQARKLLEASVQPDVDWSTLHYVTSRECRDCHVDAYRSWAASKHAAAARTLKGKERLVPACLPCHSEVYRRTDKFNPDLDAAWHGVECATCHGDGILHSAVRSRRSITRSVGAAGCRKCHDKENDPNFDYAADLARIRHW